MKALALLSALAGVACAQAQFEFTTEGRPVQIRVRHADPWAVKAMLEGESLMSPEISTILLVLGVGGNRSAQQGGQGAPGLGAPQGGSGGFITGGKLIVNPADNSLWFIPDRK